MGTETKHGQEGTQTSGEQRVNLTRFMETTTFTWEVWQEEMNMDHYLTPYTKINTRWMRNLRVKALFKNFYKETQIFMISGQKKVAQSAKTVH